MTEWDMSRDRSLTCEGRKRGGTPLMRGGAIMPWLFRCTTPSFSLNASRDCSQSLASHTRPCSATLHLGAVLAKQVLVIRLECLASRCTCKTQQNHNECDGNSRRDFLKITSRCSCNDRKRILSSPSHRSDYRQAEESLEIERATASAN